VRRWRRSERREGGREGGRAGGREGGREGVRVYILHVHGCDLCEVLLWKEMKEREGGREGGMVFFGVKFCCTKGGSEREGGREGRVYICVKGRKRRMKTKEWAHG